MSSNLFQGFPPQGLEFLRGLAAHNQREWFEQRREVYERDLLEPAKALVVDLGQNLRQAIPGLMVDPRVNRGLFRIARDTRFSPDKTPYKTHLGLWWWEGQGPRMAGSGFYFHLEPPTLMLAGGLYRFTSAQQAAFRAQATSPKPGRRLAQILGELRDQGYQIGGLRHQRLPRGFAPDSLNAELLKHDGLHAALHASLPEEIGSSALVDWCLERFLPLVPLHDWLTAQVARAE
ncbi:MAG: DUF2461 domain-containing protein [Desulfarculus sp.]|nr:DUF2461 domain-containing protein [Desulfarculus sp.]